MGDDARGNLIEKQQGAQVQKLAWDGFNRLAALETPNGKTEYAYDVFGRRIGKRHNGQTTTFVWDGDVIALEKTVEQTRHYLFEAGSFVPLAQVVEKDDTANTAYYHVDHIGTPQLLTDADGEIAWQAEYKAWGAAKAAISDAARSAGIDNPLRFQGQYFDAESGLHYNRHRYNDPETGRFISSDPIGLLGGLNTHAYAPNPVEWVDPQGLARDAKSSYPSTDVMPKIPGTERHHIIPYHLRDHPAMKDAGLDINSARNMMYLPRHCNTTTTTQRSRHSCFKLGDDKHANYDQHMRQQLDSISRKADQNDWDSERIKLEVEKLQSSTRQDLRNGKKTWP